MQALSVENMDWLQPVLGRYGLEVLSAVPLSSPYKEFVSYKVDTGKKSVFVKPIPRQQIGLESLEQRLHQVKYHNLSAMPKYYTTANDRFVTVSGSRKFLVCEWVDGTSRIAGNKGEVFSQLGQVLGELHLVDAPVHHLFDVDLEGRMHHQAHRRFVMNLPNYQGAGKEWLDNHAAECIEMAEESLSILGKRDVRKVLESERLSPQLIHGSVHLENILQRGDGRIALLNWHHIRPGCGYAEVARTLLATTGGRRTALSSFVDAYDNVRKLTEPERQLIFAFFSFPHEVWHIMRKKPGMRTDKQWRALSRTWPWRRLAWHTLRSWSTMKE